MSQPQDQIRPPSSGSPTRSAVTDQSNPPASPHPRRKPDRSCVLCHRRKIRCDKQTPCLPCARARLKCTYPTADKPFRRARKATIADVASRISDLEKTIVAASIDQGSAARDTLPQYAPLSVTLPNSPLESPPEQKALPSDEVLVRNGSSSQYINELLISKVIEEDHDKSSLLHTPDSDTKDRDADSPFHLMGILSSPSVFEEKDRGWRFSKLSATQLWHTYVRQVDYAIGFLHIPTDEITVFTAIHQPESVSKDVMALVSSIYFIATVVLGSDEVHRLLGVDRLTALRSFKKEFQNYLAEADMLENPTVVLLQGLSIYLAATRCHNHGRGIWSLYGLAVRMAQSIGLHRDGSKLGMSAFESEQRRRLWWHLLSRDSRSSEDHGISSWSTVPTYDTRLPLNVDDADLRPDMKELPPPHKGWTKLTLLLSSMEAAYTLQRMSYLPMTSTGSTPKEVIRNEMFSQLRARVEQYIRPCNIVIPLQRMTINLASCLVHKIDFVSRQQLANMENPEGRNSFATEENLISALKCLELHLDIWFDELIRPYRWSITGHPQYHMLLYVLWHLCVCPEGPSVDRAWHTVDRTFQVEHARLTTSVSRPSLNATVLQRLRKKAEIIRESTASGTRDNAVPTTKPHELIQKEPEEINQTDEGAVVRRVENENMDWNHLMDSSVPDWNILVEDLHLDLHNFSSYF